MSHITFAILALVFAILSLGHDDLIKGNLIGSFMYEGLALVFTVHVILQLMGY